MPPPRDGSEPQLLLVVEFAVHGSLGDAIRHAAERCGQAAEAKAAAEAEAAEAEAVEAGAAFELAVVEQEAAVAGAAEAGAAVEAKAASKADTAMQLEAAAEVSEVAPMPRTPAAAQLLLGDSSGGVYTIVWAAHIARGLKHVHAKNIVHRDLKPDNILLRRGFRAAIADFGISKQLSDYELWASPGPLTTPGRGRATSVKGTPRYMAPETCRGERTGFSADVWAFGIVLTELITLRPAYSEVAACPTAALLMQCIGAGSARPTPPRAEEVPHPLLAELIERCLRFEPADRPRFGDEIFSQLSALAREAEDQAARQVARGEKSRAEAEEAVARHALFLQRGYFFADADAKPTADHRLFCLGHGHFGPTFQVGSKLDGGLCAVKTLFLGALARSCGRSVEATTRAVLEEVRMMSEMEHPGLVRYYLASRHGQDLYVQTGLCRGGDMLSRLLPPPGAAPMPVAVSEIARYGREIADALRYVHTTLRGAGDVHVDCMCLQPVGSRRALCCLTIACPPPVGPCRVGTRTL